VKAASAAIRLAVAKVETALADATKALEVVR
jgi:hypothetical protein